jgi:hypothetical protein
MGKQSKQYSNGLREVREQLFHEDQAEFGKVLGKSQYQISRAEIAPEVPKAYLQTILSKFPDKEEEIREILQRHAGIHLEDWHEPEPQLSATEDEARLWAATFRTDCLRNRLAYLAHLAGLVPKRLREIPYGLLLDRPLGSSLARGPEPSDMLYPHSRGQFGLGANTVVLFGSPYKHLMASPVVKEFSEALLKTFNQQFGLRFLLDAEGRIRRRFFYFGYETFVNDLFIGQTPYRSARYVGEDNAMYYEDYGMILHVPIRDLLQRSPFPEGASRVVLVAGSHRLGTGAGARLLEDKELRTQIVGMDYPIQELGALAYRIVVRSSEFCRVERFEIIGRWPTS